MGHSAEIQLRMVSKTSFFEFLSLERSKKMSSFVSNGLVEKNLWRFIESGLYPTFLGVLKRKNVDGITRSHVTHAHIARSDSTGAMQQRWKDLDCVLWHREGAVCWVAPVGCCLRRLQGALERRLYNIKNLHSLRLHNGPFFWYKKVTTKKTPESHAIFFLIFFLGSHGKSCRTRF